ncbi:ribonuclease H-like domain-containing protein [Paenibacillus sepulcri]
MSGLRDRIMRLRGTAAAGASIAGGDEAGAGSSEENNREIAAELWEPAHTAQPDSTAIHQGELDEQSSASDDDSLATDSLTGDWDGIGVVLQESSEGFFLIRKVRYPLSHRHGLHHLSELQDTAAGLSAFERLADSVKVKRESRAAAKAGKPGTIPLGGAEPSFVDPERLLFLDLETTGLGVGAGNVPFMVGLGYMEAGAYVVEQMLIRHPAEERAMLAYLQELLPRFTHLVTYNGRTFDWPVLQNRFILNGYRHFKWEPVHIDLLHPSRSIWRNTLVSCRLSHVEEERLGIQRTDDVPGSQAPAIYFQFLADADPQPLLGVFLHNESDMLSLTCLAIRFGHLLEGRIGTYVVHPTEPEEILRTGLWLEKMGALQHAEELYVRLSEESHTPASCLCMLAERDKKCGNWPRAVLLWQKAVQGSRRSDWPDWNAHIELAMYFEHKTRQLDEALILAEEALSLVQHRYSGLRLDAKRRAEIDNIRKRIERLRNKTGRLYG